MVSRFATTCLALAALGLAAPAPTPAPTQAVANVVAAEVAKPTVPPEEYWKRGLGGDIKSGVESLASDVESKLSNFVESGILNFPNGFATGSQVEKSLGISEGDVKAQPTQVMNLPAYGNWTDKGWNVRVHGNVYKLPDVSDKKIDDLADKFLIGTSVKDLPDDQKKQARNVTRSIFVFQQSDQNVTMEFNTVSSNTSLTKHTQNAKGGAQNIKLPYETTLEGDFDTFIQLKNTSNDNGGHLLPGNATSTVQILNMNAKGAKSGNATAYLVPPEGLSVISDIDDILRVTKIYQPKEGIINTFARPFTPWMNMPDIYANWSSSSSRIHFHYLTTLPEQVTRTYMEFIYKTYPLGSFDTRPLNFSNAKETLKVRKFLLNKVFDTFPKRKFVLVADTSNHDIMKDYPAMYKDYPGQVSCILLRNTTSTDDKDKFPYDTSGFKGIPQEKYMFFNVPDDLKHIDIENGQCYNKTVKQNVTFGEQGLPLGLGDNSSDGWRVSPTTSGLGVVALAALMAML